MSIMLGSPILDAPRPSFHATWNGEAAIVELDSGALFRLTDRAGGAALAELLHNSREEIQDAAQRLIDNGFGIERGGNLEILITALDL